MSFFEDASLVLIPSAQKTSKVYSVKPTDGSGDLTFSRSNDTATRVGPDGLIEKVRTNLQTYSQDFSNAVWGKSAGATLTHSQTDPNGGTTASRLQMPSGTTNFFGTSFSGATNGGKYTHSVYMKSNTGSTQSVRLVDGVRGVAGGTLLASVTTSWQRFEVVITTASTNAGLQIDNQSGTYDNDILIAFAQSEETDFGATPYIATTSAAVSVGPVANVPRLDYLNSSCPRLLLEPQRTNALTYSEDFSNAAYTKGQSSITSNAAIAPDGTMSADKLVEDTSNNPHVIYRSPSGTGDTLSFFAKAAERNWVGVLSNNGNISFFNIANGTLGTIAASSTATITPYGNGWYRCTLYNTHGSFGMSIYLATANGTDTYTGDGTSGAFIWGAQLEESAAYATSYIPTLGAAVTRGADAASKTGISSLIGQTEGTMFVEGSTIGKESVKSNLFGALEKTSSGATIRIFYDGNSNIILGDVFNGSTFSAQMVGPAIPVGQTFKAALAYKENDFVLAVNGVIVATDNSGVVPATDDFKINTSLYNNLDAGVRQAQALLFKTRLSNADLAALTA